MQGSKVLVKFGDVLVVGQGDSSFSITSSLLEIAAAEDGAKQYLYDEQEGAMQFTLIATAEQEKALFNAISNRMVMEVIYGGVEVGDIYYKFNGLITNFSKSDPTNGLSTISVAVMPTGKITMLTVVDEEETFFTLTVNYNATLGGVTINPNFASYQQGTSVTITATANDLAYLKCFVVNGTWVPLWNGNSITINMVQDMVVEAMFIEKGDVTFTFDYDEGWEVIPNSNFITVLSGVLEADCILNTQETVRLLRFNLGSVKSFKYARIDFPAQNPPKYGIQVAIYKYGNFVAKTEPFLYSSSNSMMSKLAEGDEVEIWIGAPRQEASLKTFVDTVHLYYY